MKTLQSQRERYLKSVEAAGNVEVMEVVQKLEEKASFLNTDDCKEALSRAYIRDGNFPTDHRYYGPCSTRPVDCYNQNHARIKEYFEQRNPNFVVECRKIGGNNSYFDSDYGDCRAGLKPHLLFEKE